MCELGQACKCKHASIWQHTGRRKLTRCERPVICRQTACRSQWSFQVLNKFPTSVAPRFCERLGPACLTLSVLELQGAAAPHLRIADNANWRSLLDQEVSFGATVLLYSAGKSSQMRPEILVPTLHFTQISLRLSQLSPPRRIISWIWAADVCSALLVLSAQVDIQWIVMARKHQSA